MPDQTKRVPLPNSHRDAVFGARLVGIPNPKRRIEVTVYLRRRADLKSVGGQKVSRDQFANLYGARAEDVARLEQFARNYGLSIVEKDLARRSVVLSGTIQALSKAFGTKLERRRWKGQVFRSRTGQLFVPADLANRIEAVLGLDTRPQAKPHFRVLKPASGARPLKTAALKIFTPPQVAALYQFPPATDGTGQCIALIELGGGYKPADLSPYFSKLGIKKAPAVSAVSVNKGQNKPTGDPSGPDGEVMLDIEVAGSIAPGAKIAVYFAPNTDRGFIDAITTAIHDQVNKPSIISISWGGPEDTWTAQARNLMDSAFQSAATLDVTVLVAAGDDGSSDGQADGAVHVDFPASSPNATACGGTRLTASNATTISAETVWNDGPSQGATGGGVSEYFAVPTYQKGINVPKSASTGFAGRGVPDVAGNADPMTGYSVDVDGETLSIGGTSAVAPLYAALVARLNQSLGRPLGFLNPTLYSAPVVASAYHDVTQGNNGSYTAGKGWDACTGWGSIIGSHLLKDESTAPAKTTESAKPLPKAPPRNPPPAAHASAAAPARPMPAMRPSPPMRQAPTAGRPIPVRPMGVPAVRPPLPKPIQGRPPQVRPMPPQRSAMMPPRGAQVPPGQRRPPAAAPPQRGPGTPKPPRKP